MYRRILVPIDGSPTSKLGLKEAIGLAKGTGMRVLNVLDEKLAVAGIDAYAAADPTMLLGVLNREGRKALEDAAALARRHGIEVDTEMAEGRGRFVSDVIVDAATTWRADVIVMGTHGRRGLNRLLMGSDAERVLREATVPVLLVQDESSRDQSAKKRVRR